MEQNSLISVIIPAYNVKDYLDRCMDTVLKQTYKNIEIFLVDDGSTDDTGKLCDKYAEKDSRVKVIHKKNGGVSRARNAALDMITGEYICFVDSDDYTSLEMFEKLISAVKENDCDIAICGKYIEDDGQISIEGPKVDQMLIFDNDGAIDRLIEDKIINNYPWDKIYKKYLFDNIRFPEGRNYEDVAIMHKVFYKAKKICRIPECLYYYQKRSGSISDHLTDKRKWYRNCLDMLTAKIERYMFLRKRKKEILTQKCMASIIPTIYEAIRLGHAFSDNEKYKQYMCFLKKHKKEIKTNPYVKNKDKKILFFYSNQFAYSLYCLRKKNIRENA